MVMSDCKRSPVGAFNTVGAETLEMFNRYVAAASLLYTATAMSSMPTKLPWLSISGTNIMIRNRANGAMVLWLLLDGTTHGSLGTTTTLLAMGVLGG